MEVIKGKATGPAKVIEPSAKPVANMTKDELKARVWNLEETLRKTCCAKEEARNWCEEYQSQLEASRANWREERRARQEAEIVRDMAVSALREEREKARRATDDAMPF